MEPSLQKGKVTTIHIAQLKQKGQVSPQQRDRNLTLLLCFVFSFQYALKIYINGVLSSQIPNDSPEIFSHLDVYTALSGAQTFPGGRISLSR